MERLQVTYWLSCACSGDALNFARAIAREQTVQVPPGGIRIDAAARTFARYGQDAMLLIGGSLLMQKDLEGAPGGYSTLERHAHPHAVVEDAGDAGR